jgi:response regulator RpfG family c-di-GMP phosphodiesterase
VACFDASKHRFWYRIKTAQNLSLTAAVAGEVNMPDQKMYDLCRRIRDEKDSERLIALVEALTKLLDEEQQAIKAKIRANIGGSVTTAE